MKLGPAVLDLQVLSLDPTGFAEPLAKGGQRRSICLGRRPVEEADHRHRPLLGAGQERIRHSAGKNRYETPAFHAEPVVPQFEFSGTNSICPSVKSIGVTRPNT